MKRDKHETSLPCDEVGPHGLTKTESLRASLDELQNELNMAISAAEDAWMDADALVQDRKELLALLAVTQVHINQCLSRVTRLIRAQYKELSPDQKAGLKNEAKNVQPYP